MVKTAFLLRLCFLLMSGVLQTLLSNPHVPDDLSLASWISDAKPPCATDSLYYLDDPAPHFRKEIILLKGDIQSARLCITAAGYYTVTLNGARIGDSFLDPAWTNYDKRVYYSEHEITSLLTVEKNCLGVVVGNGFYNPLPLRMWGNRNLREVLPVGRPAFIAQLTISYRDGRQQIIKTDTTWKYAYGPILRNNVYLGIVYDARRELGPWDQFGFEDSDWQPAFTVPGPAGRLQKAFFPPIKITDRISPLAVTEPQMGVYLVDMGTNFTGVCSMRLRGRPGDTVVLRYGERVYEDGRLNPMTAVCGQIKRKGQGGPGAPDVAWQTDTYRFGRCSPVCFTPDFTFHAFRYMEVSGLSYRPALSDFVGLALNTAVEGDNAFTCSSALLNRIQAMATRTFRSNLQSVQSDCPARERFGYGGDLNAVAEAYLYNFDMHSFYRKTIYDWVDAMKDTSFVDTAPFVGIEYCGISWESAFLITQHLLLRYYNDVALIEALYPLDLKWMNKVAKIHPYGMVESGLADHEALQPSPVQLIGTLHYLQCARIMTVFAQLMNDRANTDKFQKLAERLQTVVQQKFCIQPIDSSVNQQALYASLLYHQVIPGPKQRAAVNALRKAMAQGPEGHFTTGIFTTKYILEAASKHGLVDEVFSIVQSEAFPGWGYMIDRGATTLWETWKESDNVYSNCHPMFGSVSEWFYRWLAGIQPAETFFGFKEFILCPHTPQGLNSVACSYRSPFGVIRSHWKKTPDGVIYEFEVPRTTTARFQIPVARAAIIRIERQGEGEVASRRLNAGTFRRKFSAGVYKITLTRQGSQ
ncbi:MAG TPA: family 78 glycoside hydrolase catalytic domain [bacterium]|nr:family 78 glycoside hydrolase catalytic domain [bacterium]